MPDEESRSPKLPRRPLGQRPWFIIGTSILAFVLFILLISWWLDSGDSAPAVPSTEAATAEVRNW